MGGGQQKCFSRSPNLQIFSLSNDLRSATNIPKTLVTSARFPGDTGSSPVQIASLTVRIEALRSHCSQHKKDKHNRRGLDALVTKRRKLMQYLERKDFDSYADVVKKLGLKALK